VRAAGEKPSADKIKRRWNAHRKAELPWTYEVTKCASGQAIMDLGAAFANFFRDCKKPRNQRHFRYPRFKKKRLNESFISPPAYPSVASVEASRPRGEHPQGRGAQADDRPDDDGSRRSSSRI
jgi:hypothetical protein